MTYGNKFPGRISVTNCKLIPICRHIFLRREDFYRDLALSRNRSGIKRCYFKVSRDASYKLRVFRRSSCDVVCACLYEQ